MASIEPGNSFHIARAYQAASSPARPAALPSSGALRITPSASQSEPVQLSGIQRLIAGAVPGRIDFAGDQPVQVGGPLPLYRHPADRNTAATAVHAGRVLDTMA